MNRACRRHHCLVVSLAPSTRICKVRCRTWQGRGGQDPNIKVSRLLKESGAVLEAAQLLAMLLLAPG